MWLVQQEIFDKINAVSIDSYTPSLAEIESYNVRVNTSNALAISNEGVATIHVNGLLTDEPDWMAELFGMGNTTYKKITGAVQAANADPRISSIRLIFNSGGGQASAAWMTAMDAIKNSTKPTIAIVESMAASAAYGLASQASEILAINSMSVLGSVGVVSTRYNDPDLVDITSTNAENKRPNVNTEEGKAVVRAELDQFESQFISRIASGRDTTISDIIANYGKGGIILAPDALKVGMIDGMIDNLDKPLLKTEPLGAFKMDLKTLKLEHSAVYAEAVQEGVTKERERVEAHMVLGKAYKATDIALAAIADGSECTQLMQAKYLAAGVASNTVAALGDEEKSVANAATNVQLHSKDATAEAEAVVAEVERQLGLGEV